MTGLKILTGTLTLAVLLTYFSITTVKAQYAKIHDFNGTNGGGPQYDQNLVSDGTYLYGMTAGGGANLKGTIFKIKPDGTNFSKLLDFSGTVNGRGPQGSLIYDGTFLYGMTRHGGTGDSGTIFKILPDGTGFSKLLDLSSAQLAYPFGSLLYDGTYLYGMSSNARIFKIKSDGTGYTQLYLSTNVSNGGSPKGSLISDGTFLYGMTQFGGTNNMGVVFKIKTDGTGYLKLLDFTGTNGEEPWGSLISDGTFLFGMTRWGGTNNSGTVFKIKTDGTGYSKLLNMPGANGAQPFGSLLMDGVTLYGMTYGGGTNGMGTIFKINSDGSGYSKLYDFSGGTNGRSPYGTLISDGNYLYGMAGDDSNSGVIFKFGVGSGLTENNSEVDFHIYPNPSFGKFILTCEKNMREIVVYNIYGGIAYAAPAEGKRLNMNLDLPEGIYFFRLKAEEGVVTKKMIIKK